MRRQPRRFAPPEEYLLPATRADSRSHQNIRDDDEPCRECAPKASAVPEFSRQTPRVTSWFPTLQDSVARIYLEFAREFLPGRCRAAPLPGEFRQAPHPSFPCLRRAKLHKPTL